MQLIVVLLAKQQLIGFVGQQRLIRQQRFVGFIGEQRVVVVEQQRLVRQQRFVGFVGEQRVVLVVEQQRLVRQQRLVGFVGEQRVIVVVGQQRVSQPRESDGRWINPVSNARESLVNPSRLDSDTSASLDRWTNPVRQPRETLSRWTNPVSKGQISVKSAPFGHFSRTPIVVCLGSGFFETLPTPIRPLGLSRLAGAPRKIPTAPPSPSAKIFRFDSDARPGNPSHP